MQEGGALATQRSCTVYLQTVRKRGHRFRANPGPACSFIGKNDINRISFHVHCSLINPISHIKKKSKSTVFTTEYKRPISTGNIMHVKNQDASVMA